MAYPHPPMARALLIEIDEALGHWLVAVLGEAGLSVTWERSIDGAARSVASLAGAPCLCIVEGVIGGQGVELCAEAKRLGCATILLIPRGGAVIAGVADRILEHPLTRTGLLEALQTLGATPSPPPAPVPPAPVPAPAPPAQPAPLTAAPSAEEARRMAAAEDRIRLGLAALQEGNFDAAVMELDAAGALSGSDPRPRLYGTWARYSRVRAAVAQASALRSELERWADAARSADARYFLAAAAHDSGDVERAVLEAEHALAADPGHALARQLLEIVNLERGKAP